MYLIVAGTCFCFCLFVFSNMQFAEEKKLMPNISNESDPGTSLNSISVVEFWKKIVDTKGEFLNANMF